jgi:tetratricopeptide (TPR) repeat protein
MSTRSGRRNTKTLPTSLRRGIELLRAGRVDDAERLFRGTLAEHPEHAEALHLLGTLCFNQGRLDEARQYLSAAVRRRASLAPAWLELGHTLRDLGEFTQALDAFSRAIRHDPDLGAAHFARAQLRRHLPADSDTTELAAMRQAHARSRAGTRSRRDLAWALATACAGRGEVEPTLAHLAEAHAIDAAAMPYDRAGAAEYFRRLRAAIDGATLAELAAAGHGSELPVFVIGPPRSGTSLVEQILASHSAVHGAGELRSVGQLCGQLERASGRPFAEAFRAVSERDRRRMGDAYLARLTRLAPTARRVVDKMPANLLAAALLAALFPAARFVYCERQRAPVAWSIYSTRFAEPHAFANHPADLLAYLDACAQQRDYLVALLGERLLVVDYAELVAVPEEQTRRLLRHLGLEEEPACFRPHETRRSVRTASAEQVRRPIYAGADQRCAPFIAAFPALREALEQA